MHILENVQLWNFFRKTLDLTAGLYRKRLACIEKFGISRGASVLDIGCGTGQFSKITNGDYLGLDMDRRYIEEARRNYGGNGKKRFECLRLQDANLGKKQFDVVLLMELTHHIGNSDLEDLLLSLSKIVKGHLIIADPVRQSRKNWAGRILASLDRGHYIRPQEVELDFIKKYFEVVDFQNMKILGVEGVMIFAKPVSSSRSEREGEAPTA